MNRWRVGEDIGSKETDRCPLTGTDVVRYVQRPWGVHMDIVRNKGGKGMD
jgi:hypothetical protein